MVTMAERMVRVETKVEELVKTNDESHNRIEIKLDKFIQSAEKKFASKWIERVVYFLITAILGGFVTKIIGLW